MNTKPELMVTVDSCTVTVDGHCCSQILWWSPCTCCFTFSVTSRPRRSTVYIMVPFPFTDQIKMRTMLSAWKQMILMISLPGDNLKDLDFVTNNSCFKTCQVIIANSYMVNGETTLNESECCVSSVIIIYQSSIPISGYVLKTLLLVHECIVSLLISGRKSVFQQAKWENSLACSSNICIW